MRPLFIMVLVLCFCRGATASELVRSYGWVDVGGLVAFPEDHSGKQYGWGLAFSTGAEFFNHLQVGGRLRFLGATERICDVTAYNGISCGSDSGANMISLGLELRLRFALSARLAVAFGGSISQGTWSGCLGNDGCGTGGANLAGDIRLLSLLGKRVGVHLAYEEQVLYASPTLNMPSFWLGLDW